MWNKKEVLTFVADITPLMKEEKYKEIYDKVPDFRKVKADELKGAEHRAQSVGAWYLWMKIQKMLNLQEEVVFNLSHSGQYVLCGLAPVGEKVGCDVEILAEFREKVAKRFFCDSEYQMIMGLPEEIRADWFYRYWVLKESFMKATRKGIGLPINSFEISFTGGVPQLVKQPEEIKDLYYYKEYEIEGAKIAVCSTCHMFAKDFQKITL